MIARQEGANEIWNVLAADLPAGVIAWRQDGKPITKDGKHFARFVCYIEANTVRERLDNVVPGEWDLTLEPLPVREVTNRDGVVESDASTAYSFKARLQVLGVIREDVGHGKDWKQAATDAFKRVAVRFGIGHELYDYELNWVELDGDGKYAKPVEDPGAAYARRHGGAAPARPTTRSAPTPSSPVTSASASDDSAVSATTNGGTGATSNVDAMSCPKCGGNMWDNRLTKTNPKAPDYKCRDRSCDGVIWPPKESKGTVMDEQDVPQPTKTRKVARPADQDEIPF